MAASGSPPTTPDRIARAFGATGDCLALPERLVLDAGRTRRTQVATSDCLRARYTGPPGHLVYLERRRTTNHVWRTESVYDLTRLRTNVSDVESARSALEAAKLN